MTFFDKRIEKIKKAIPGLQEHQLENLKWFLCEAAVCVVADNEIFEQA